MESVFVPFITVFIGEFLDKSQLILLLLAARFQNRMLLFAVSVAAFAVVDGIAIISGSLVTSFIPAKTITIAAGALFVIFGALSLFRSAGEQKKQSKAASLPSAFLLIFLSEWGDKTQLASGLFATRYSPFLVFIGVMAALSILSITAIYFGRRIAQIANREVIEKIAGILFLTIGGFFLVSAF